MAGPLATLSNKPGATTAVMMEPCSLPCSHIGASLIPRGQRQCRDNTSVGLRDLGMFDVSLIAGWAGRCLQDGQGHWRPGSALPGAGHWGPLCPTVPSPQRRGPRPPRPPGRAGQRGSAGRGQILARQRRGLRTGEQWGGKTVTSNWCPGQSFHADAVLWVRKLLVSQEHRRQI